MTKSMTGYGKGEHENNSYRFKVEIKTVNHKYSDILIKMPRHLNYLEDRLKKTIKDNIIRGKVDVFIYLEYIDESAIDVKVDIPLAKSYKKALETLIGELNLEDSIRLNNILGMSEVVRTERRELDEDLIWESLSVALELAAKKTVEMREREGKELKTDILFKLDSIEQSLLNIEERSPQVVLEYGERLKERISELIDNSINIDEDRLNFEIILFADKSSIDEEIVRLKSHIKQFKSILEENDSVGRKLDFLIQEFNREINTIGSKANDIIISKFVVELKAELEKIREQVQNIE